MDKIELFFFFLLRLLEFGCHGGGWGLCKDTYFIL